MPERLTRFGSAREWLVALCAYALLIAPFGCEIQTMLGGVGGSGNLSPTSTGFFVNQDTSDSLLAAGRGASGDAFFVYGARNAAGGIGRIDSILVEAADGSSSYIVFELGRPVYARGPDGSYVSVTYDQVSALSLTATVTIHDAASGAEETQQISIDLTQTAQQVAALIETVTGRSVEVPVVPSGGTGKPQQRAGFLATAALMSLVAIPIALVVQVAMQTMGQVLATMFSMVAMVMQATLLAVMSPLFLLPALLNGVILEIELVGLPEVFITLPGPPTIIIE